MSSHSKQVFAWAALAAAGFIAGLTPEARAQEWIRQFGTSESEWPWALAPDGVGGVMIGGETWGSLGGPYSGGGASDAFLARYDGAGNRLWIRQFGTFSSSETIYALAPDAGGGVIVAGSTTGNLGGPNPGNESVLLARYDSAGNRRWIRQFGSINCDQATAVAPDGAGGVMVAGWTNGNLGGPSAGGFDAFLARHDSAGNQLWLRQFGTSETDVARALAPDGAGGVFIAGGTRGDLGAPIPDPGPFLARYDSSGNRLWIRQFGAGEPAGARALAPDGAGGVIVAGGTSGDLGGPNAGGDDAFLARYDSAGNQLWIRQFGTSSNDSAAALSADGAGGVIVAGDTSGSLGGSNAGMLDVFLACYDSAGNQLSIRQFGTAFYDQAHALASDGAGGVMVAGPT